MCPILQKAVIHPILNSLQAATPQDASSGT